MVAGVAEDLTWMSKSKAPVIHCCSSGHSQHFRKSERIASDTFSQMQELQTRTMQSLIGHCWPYTQPWLCSTFPRLKKKGGAAFFWPILSKELATRWEKGGTLVEDLLPKLPLCSSWLSSAPPPQWGPHPSVKMVAPTRSTRSWRTELLAPSIRIQTETGTVCHMA